MKACKQTNTKNEEKKMKVKFRFGIKSYSGTLDELNYANFEDRSVVIGRMLPANRELTEQNVTMGNKMNKIGEFYAGISDAFKADLKAYAKKMYNLKAYKKGIAGNTYSTFVKLLWEASKLDENPISIEALSVDDLLIGSYAVFDSVKVAVENDLLPKVDGYEDLTNSISA